MTGALNALRRSAVELLEGCGLHAVAAMEPDSRKRWTEPVVAVALNKVTCAAGGFRNYLGLKTDEATGAVSELYGRAVELTLALDIYAPRSGGESACRETLDAMTEAVMCRGIGGLTALELEAGSVAFLEQEGLYRLPVRCRCRAWLVAAVDEGGAFADFEVRGRRV